MSGHPSLPPGSSIQSKGYTLKGGLAYIEEAHGETGRAALLEAVEDEEHRRILSGTILSGSWYPFATQVALYRAADRAFGRGDLEECRKIGRFTADYEFSTIHRILLKLGNLGHMMRLAGALWGRYYSLGKMRVVDSTSDSAVVEISEFNPIHRAFCTDLGGWMERTMELSGCQEGSLRHTQCLLDGDGVCRYEASWKE